MSYQVLARKWRPRLFTEMVGQEHVLRALINGLDNDRIHHAYLFTGTRGVGKTTIARILAKCLNCETGVSSNPCGECSACREIGEGRFVDLIEVDAASRTKVEDTRELLDNVQYAPTRGRYKIYLIDEVHMLSTHSFNALLKTLEEPPPHVKFLLATTDPQKLPVTVLSRCLQFNLKNLGPERIVEHLKFILGEENIPFEESALWELGRAADGSMRDALSLTDQAIAHGGGMLTGTEVNAMLGTIDRTAVVDICRAVAGGDPQDVIAKVERLADHAPDYSAALADMLSIWHQVAIAQAMPDALDPVQEHHGVIIELSQAVSREDVQLMYQITLLGRKDLPHAADPRSGFEMVLLRLLAFKPDFSEQPKALSRKTDARTEQTSQASGAAQSVKKPIADPVKAGEPSRKAVAKSSIPPETPVSTTQTASEAPEFAKERSISSQAMQPEALRGAVPDDGFDQGADIADDYDDYARQRPPDKGDYSGAVTPPVDRVKQGGRLEVTEVPEATIPRESVDKVPLPQLAPDKWIQVCQGLGQGLLPNLAANMVLRGCDSSDLQLILDQENSALYDDTHRGRLADVLSDYFCEPVTVTVTVGDTAGQTPRSITERLRAERLQKAVESLEADYHVQELCRVFGGKLIESSVKPIDQHVEK